MRRVLTAVILVTVLVALLALVGATPQSRFAAPFETQFATLEVHVDSGDLPLAAWQVEITAKPGAARIVGIEGGDSKVYAEPPFYDPKAMMQERVIIAAFSTADAADLPAGRTRVATIHVQIVRDGDDGLFNASVQAAATVGGDAVEATVTLVRGHDS